MCYNKNGMNITGEFMACMFKYKEEEEFENAFQELMKKLNEHSWLKFIYDSKEKWAYYFMKRAI
jgi:NMD protein affecting ribosome stability and mRNA decay